MDGKALLKQLAPTAASFLFSPAAGAVLSKAIEVFDMPADSTINDVRDAVRKGDFSGDQLLKIKELELSAQTKEKELGIRAEEIAAADRDSARKANVAAGTQKYLFGLSMLLLAATLGSEIWVLFNGYPVTLPEMIVGRVLGLMDAISMMVLSYWYGTTAGSAHTKELLAQSAPVK